MAEMRIGEFLISKGYLTSQDIDSALQKQAEFKQSGRPYAEIGNVLITFNYLSEEVFCKVIHEYLEYSKSTTSFDRDLSYIAVNTLNLTKDVLSYIERHFDLVKELKTLPYRLDRDESGKIKEVAYVTAGRDLDYNEFISRFKSLNHLDATTQHVTRALEYSFATLISKLASQFGRTVTGDYSKRYTMNLNDKIQNMFRDATRLKASDIFITPLKDRIQVKFKVDSVGRIYEKNFAPPSEHQRIANIILASCGLPSTELNKGTVDGAIESLFGELDRSWSARVNIMATVCGYKLVFRLIPNEQKILTLKDLGMPKDIEDYVKENTKKEAGLVLITGHMGSGKNTTIYASLLEIDNVIREIATVEDPVERRLPGISQTSVVGAMDFGKVSKAMVRQALDVLFIGEIRDAETARLSIEGAGAGMLIFSTLHIDRVAQVWSRIHSLDESLLTRFITSLEGIMTQKLVRKICPHCKTEVTFDQLSENERQYINNSKFYKTVNGKRYQFKYSGKFYKGLGCPKCAHSGYSGLIVCTERLPLDYSTKLKLSGIKNFVELEHFTDVYMEDHQLSFKYQGAKLLNAGITSLDEIMRKCVFDFEIDNLQEVL